MFRIPPVEGEKIKSRMSFDHESEISDETVFLNQSQVSEDFPKFNKVNTIF